VDVKGELQLLETRCDFVVEPLSLTSTASDWRVPEEHELSLIEVDEEGALYWRDVSVNPEMLRLLVEAAGSLKDVPPTVLRVDPKAPCEPLRDALAALKRAGICDRTRCQLVVQPFDDADRRRLFRSTPPA
jgi:biopolymer transport protein ExbD